MALIVDGGSYNPYSKLQLVEKEDKDGPLQKRIRALPQGSRLWIDRVHWVHGIDDAWVVAVGKTAENEKFEFFLGGFRNFMEVPPWEAGRGEKVGRIEWQGKVTYEQP